MATQQQQPQRPYYAGPPGQGQQGMNGSQPPFQQQQQQPFPGQGMNYNPARPMPPQGSQHPRPIMNPNYRPSPPSQPGGAPVRPQGNGVGPYPGHQQPGFRPTPPSPQGARLPPGVRPQMAPNQMRSASPSPSLQNQALARGPGQTPTPAGTPGSAPFHQSQQQQQQQPQQPGAQYSRNATPMGHYAPTQPPHQQPGIHPPQLQQQQQHHQPSYQQQPPSQQYQQHQEQQPTPPSVAQEPNHGLNGATAQMSNLALSDGHHQQQQQQPPPVASGLPFTPPGMSGPSGPPPVAQGEAKKTATRAKRVFATDPSVQPPPQHQQQQQSYNGAPNNGLQQQQQQPYGQQSMSAPHPSAPLANGYSQPPYQPQPAVPSTQPQYQQPPQQQQQQQMNPPQVQQTRPQAPAQPGSKPRIDPNQIPSPVAVQEADQREWDQNPFVTSSRTMATPLASTDFRAIDGGNCNPRFFRMTTYNLPNTEDLLSTSQMPMGLVIQPLAKLRADEAPIEIVDFGEAGPARCRRCKAYINPYMIFTDGGRHFMCNMCLFENEIDPNYFCNLDMNGRRCDLDQRPELRNGSIEFAVPKEYWSKTPTPASYVFAIDVSWTAIQSGMLAQCVSGIKEALWDINGVSKLTPGAQVGILTYDKNVHFYNLSSSLDQAQMMVVPDVNDIFVPLSEGFLVNPETSQEIIGSLLDMLPQLFAENKTTEPVIGAVVQAVRMALEARGGKLVIFQTALPTFGPGALKHREDTKLYGTDKERSLYAPQDDFYKKLAEQCVDAGLSIDLFLFPNTYIDVASLGCLSTITGGEMHLMPNFHAGRDGDKLIGNIGRIIDRPFGFNALMRVRCSTGLRITEHFGNFHMKNSTDIELAGIDSEKAFGVLIKHDGRLDEKTEASFQVALLYTTADGQRRVRVHNFSTPVTSLLGNVFRWADMDTTVNFLSKGAIAQALSKPMNEVRDALTEKCVKILSAYRKNCASSTAPGQLILPESFKLFPLYALTLLKSRSLRGGRDTGSDARVHQMRLLKSMSVADSIAFFYPRMFAVHALAEENGIPDDVGRVLLPPLVRVSFARLDPAGAYMLENGQALYLWLGRQVSSDFLMELFGVATLEEVDPTMRRLPELATSTNTRIRAIQTYLQSQRAKYLTLTIVRHELDPIEMEFSNQLAEDKNNDALSYVDYLCHVHRLIQTEVSTRPHEVPTSLWTSR